MLNRLTGLLPPEGIKIIVVFFLSFLIGFEREERRAAEPPGRLYFGGVRTFPLIGLIGYAIALLAGSQVMPVLVGFAVVAAFFLLSYQNKLQDAGTRRRDHRDVGAGHLPGGSPGLSRRILDCHHAGDPERVAARVEGDARRVFGASVPGPDIFAFTKFLLLTAVILPIVPDQTFGSFGFNPFKTWLIVVAASGISYGSYLLQKVEKGEGALWVSAVIGGIYSSTATTVVLAKRARQESAPHLYSGSILMASGVMYLRFLVLVGLFDWLLMKRLLVSFLLVGGAGLAAGWLWSRRSDAAGKHGEKCVADKNPLELSAAFLFALLYVILLAATHYVTLYLGRGGVYGLAALTGLSDITPFVLGLTQSHGMPPMNVAAAAILIAAASNSVVKGAYAFAFADRKTGTQALALLLALAALGLLPLFF